MWSQEPNGDLSTRLYGLRLVVRKANGFVRFMLYGRQRRHGREVEVLLRSGCEETVAAAQERAIQRAAGSAPLLERALAVVEARSRKTRGAASPRQLVSIADD